MSAPDPGALPGRLRDMVAELAAIPDLEGKYDALIEMGEELPDLAPESRTEGRRVRGCQSVVHAYAEAGPGGTVALKGHADALIVNGLLALLVRGLDGLTPEGFLAVDPRFIEATGVLGALTPSRVNGFYNIHQRLKADVQALAGADRSAGPAA